MFFSRILNALINGKDEMEREADGGVVLIFGRQLRKPENLLLRLTPHRNLDLACLFQVLLQ